MLSIVDLIDAGTMTREMAAYSLAAINAGASFMVGALPGGAGKTTVMGALLNFVPSRVRLVLADSGQTIDAGLQESRERGCYVCHEIGNGPYYAYLWGAALRRYFELPAAGHMIATNLHADTYDQARNQVCGDNRVPADAFRRMNLMYFLALDRRGWNVERRITAIWESNAQGDHHPVFGADASKPLSRATRLVSAGRLDTARKAIDAIMGSGVCTIEDVRTALMEDTTWTRSR